MPDVRKPIPPHADPSTLRLKLDEEARAGARIKVVGVGAFGRVAGRLRGLFKEFL